MENASNIQSDVLLAAGSSERGSERSWVSYLPVILVIAASLAMLGLRIQIGAGFISDGALMMLALACYILAALFQLTDLYAPSTMAL
jgi:hypothetical protein